MLKTQNTPPSSKNSNKVSKLKYLANIGAKIIFNNFLTNKKIDNLLNNAEKHQEKTFSKLTKKAKETEFGKKYNFTKIKNYKDFQTQVPIFHYEEFFEERIKPMLKWEKNQTRPWKMKMFARTWWTTSNKEKFVPVTKEAIKTNHMSWPNLMLNFYFKENPNSKIFEGKIITVWWWFAKNPETWEDNVWFISAILQKESPKFIKSFKAPNEKVSFNLSRDEKVNWILDNLVNDNITWLAGIPLRNQSILQKVLEQTWKKKIQEVRPSFEVFFTWWTRFKPYEESFEKMRWKNKVNVWNVYNASEWVFAINTDNNSDDWLLLTNHGIFYEFIKLDDYYKYTNNKSTLQTKTLKIDQVNENEEYVIVISSNAWLRRYILWDTIKFTNKTPYKIQVTWRTKFFIDAFNEHTLLPHITKAINETQKKLNFKINEFTVWPDVKEKRYQRIIELDNANINDKLKEEFSWILDQALQNSNDNYRAKREDNWWMLKWYITFVNKNSFSNWFNSKWKAGWQTKIPQMKNDLEIINDIKDFLKISW